MGGIVEYVRFINGEYRAGRFWVCKNPPSLGQFLRDGSLLSQRKGEDAEQLSRPS